MAKTDFLYHGTSAAIDGGMLRALPNKTVTGIAGNYIFACDDEVMAHAYALKQSFDALGIPRMRMCTVIGRTVCVVMEDMHLLPALPKGQIYKVPSANFEAVHFEDGRFSGEYIATVNIPLKGLDVISGITPEDVMRKYVQIFFMNDATPQEAAHMLETCHTVDRIKGFIANKKFIHYNAVTGIYPYSAFLHF